MAARRSGGTRTEMIHCPYCGEDYAASYRHCPFCDEIPPEEDYDYEDEEPRARGGKRLINNTRGGGYGGGPSPLRIIGTVLSLAIIVAAVIIVVVLIKPLVDKGHTTLTSPNPQQNTQTTPGPVNSSPGPVDNSPAPATTPDPADPSPAATPPTADPTPQVPAGQTATGFTINRSDFTLSRAGESWNLKPTYTPAGSTGTITWTSDKPEVAKVNEYGVVTAVSRGTANITATLAGGFTQTCIVRCNFTDESTGADPTPTPTPAAGLKLNHTDFTFSSLNDTPVTMRVSGTSSTPAWSIGNSEVASISSDGVVRPVGKGTTTITCTVDGQTLTCIVRCNFKDA